LLRRYNWSSPEHKIIANITPAEGEDFLRWSAHPLELSMLECKVAGVAVSCSDTFTAVATESGEMRSNIL